MKCAACGAPLSAWHRFCRDCGEARPRWPQPFEACVVRFQSLISYWEQGQLNDADFEAGLRDLAFPYDDSYWTIGAQSGNWYRHDGRGWVRGDPLQATALADSTLAASQPSAEPFSLDTGDGVPRQDTQTAAAYPRATGTSGPRPTVRLNMPEVGTPAAAPVATTDVAQPVGRTSGMAPLQAHQQPQQQARMGCVGPALTGFIAALVLLCVLVALAAWLQPSLLRPLTQLFSPGA